MRCIPTSILPYGVRLRTRWRPNWITCAASRVILRLRGIPGEMPQQQYARDHGIARFVVDSDPLYGVVEGEPGSEEVTVIPGDPFFNGIQPTQPGTSLKMSASLPRSSLAEGDRASGATIPNISGSWATKSRRTIDFLKPNTSVIGPNEPMVLPEFSDEVSYEAELCVIIGGSARTFRRSVSTRSSSVTPAATTLPPGMSSKPTAVGPRQGLRHLRPAGPVDRDRTGHRGPAIQGRLNGELRQDGSTSQMIRGVRELVSYASQAFTLLPGDVIMTGTPAGVGLVQAATASRWRSRASAASPTRWSAADRHCARAAGPERRAPVLLPASSG